MSTSLTDRTVSFFGHGGGVAWYLLGGMLVVAGASTWLYVDTLVARRFERDVTRMVAEDDMELLSAVEASSGQTKAALEEAQSAEPPVGRPYLVVSLADNRLWLKKDEDTVYTTQVATGSGKSLVQEGGDSTWKFDTPRGRLVVLSKEKDPLWNAPDWHYVEQARKRGLGVAHLERGGSVHTSDGGTITTQGDDVVKVDANGNRTVFTAVEGREVVADGQLIVPPSGTNQRKFAGVLGVRRLNLGNGYALHGTDHPESIGHSVSHGCIRLRNEDIMKLYDMVDVGTPVYIY